MLTNALTRTTPRTLSRDPFWGLMDRFFNETFGDTDRLAELPVTRNWVPPVDIVETEEAFVATADLPGLKKEDIDVSIEDNVLTVSGERSFEKENEGTTFRRIERSYGSFRRAFTLPGGIEVDKLEASFKDGVLTLTMPKSEQAKARKIAVS